MSPAKLTDYADTFAKAVDKARNIEELSRVRPMMDTASFNELETYRKIELRQLFWRKVEEMQKLGSVG